MFLLSSYVLMWCHYIEQRFLYCRAPMLVWKVWRRGIKEQPDICPECQLAQRLLGSGGNWGIWCSTKRFLSNSRATAKDKQVNSKHMDLWCSCKPKIPIGTYWGNSGMSSWTSLLFLDCSWCSATTVHSWFVWIRKARDSQKQSSFICKLSNSWESGGRQIMRKIWRGNPQLNVHRVWSAQKSLIRDTWNPASVLDRCFHRPKEGDQEIWIIYLEWIESREGDNEWKRIGRR